MLGEGCGDGRGGGGDDKVDLATRGHIIKFYPSINRTLKVFSKFL